LDILPAERIPDAVAEMLRSGADTQIVLLSLWDLLRARRNSEYRTYVSNAALVIPISKSLIGGAHFLTGKTPIRYMPFDFVVKLLTALEQKNGSVYLLGARRRSLQTAERNIRQTFPGARVVGRCAGWFHRQDEPDIIRAIKKASPSLLLVGRGVSGDEKWIERNKRFFGPGIQLWCSDLFDVFSERKKRPSRAVFERGLEGLLLCVRFPWRCIRIFPYIYYKILLLFYRLFRRGQP
jgi:N-acetylglucosaminyldiphosphoundecaprenol N-acetyl-beta-D-mannosaminyltransferase